MNLYTVNGLEHEAISGLKTWGQLLEQLETGAGPDRSVVTAVRFGGVDEPSYREADVLSLTLAQLAPVDVDVAPVDQLLTAAVNAAVEALGPLAVNAREAADAFRRHDLTAARQGLADVVATLQMLTSLTVAVVQHDPAVPSDPGRPSGDPFLDRLGRCLESLVAGNANEDWISVADILEYEMAELLPAWEGALQIGARGPAEFDEPVATSAAGR